MGGVNHRRRRPWLLHLRAIFLSVLFLSSLFCGVLIRDFHLVALSPAVVDGQDLSVSSGSCSSFSSFPFNSLSISFFTGAQDPFNAHLRSVGKGSRNFYHRLLLSTRKSGDEPSRQWPLVLHFSSSMLRAGDAIVVPSLELGFDDILASQQKTFLSLIKPKSHAYTIFLMLKPYLALNGASESLHNLDKRLYFIIRSELCTIFSLTTVLCCTSMFDAVQFQARAKMICSILKIHHGSVQELLNCTFQISGGHGSDLNNDSACSDTPIAPFRRRSFTFHYVHVPDGAYSGNTNYSNPNIPNVLLGPYGPVLYNKEWVLVGALEWAGLGYDCFNLFTYTQHLFDYECYIMLASLSDVLFPIRESTIFSGFTQRILFPVRISSVQRLNSPLERFQTALMGALIGLFKAASFWSTSEKCENTSFEHLDPIEDNLGDHHRRTMCFGDLSFYFLCSTVARLFFYMFIVWFEDAINMDVLIM